MLAVSGSVTISYAPRELLNVICDQLDKQTLLACTCVCHHWSSSAQARLLESIVIQNYEFEPEHHFKHFLAFLSSDAFSRSPFDSFVKELTLGCEEPSPEQWFYDPIDAEVIGFLLEKLPRLHTLRLREIHIGLASHSPRMWRTPRQMKLIWLQRVWVHRGDEPACTAARARAPGSSATSSFAEFLNLFSTVEVLRVEHVATMRARSDLPGLRSFERLEQEGSRSDQSVSARQALSDNLCVQHFVCAGDPNPCTVFHDLVQKSEGTGSLTHPSATEHAMNIRELLRLPGFGANLKYLHLCSITPYGPMKKVDPELWQVVLPHCPHLAHVRITADARNHDVHHVRHHIDVLLSTLLQSPYTTAYLTFEVIYDNLSFDVIFSGIDLMATEVDEALSAPERKSLKAFTILLEQHTKSRNEVDRALSSIEKEAVLKGMFPKLGRKELLHFQPVAGASDPTSLYIS